MDDSSLNNWSFTDTTRAGKSCRVYTEHNGQFETEDMEAFGHGTFQFYKKKVQTNAIQVGCSNERKGCKVRALISLTGEFLKYLGETHGPPIHNHFPFYGSSRQPLTGTGTGAGIGNGIGTGTITGTVMGMGTGRPTPDKSHSSQRVMTRLGENRHGYQFYQCPSGYVFFVNGVTKLKTNIVELEMSCAERRDGCKARVTCNSEDLVISRKRGEHDHLPVSEEALRTRQFDIQYRDAYHEPMDCQHSYSHSHNHNHSQNQNQNRSHSQSQHQHQHLLQGGSIEETDTDSSDTGYAVEERTPYSSEIIGPEDGPNDSWADPIAVCSDHNYTIDLRNRQHEASIVYEVDPKSQELVVVSADSFHDFFDHVPDAEVIVEIPFSADEGQVPGAVFATEGLCTKIPSNTNKTYVSCGERT